MFARHFKLRAPHRLLIALAVGVVFAGIAASGFAFWVASATTGSAGRAAAGFMPTGNTPTLLLSGRDVTVSWAQNKPAFLGGAPLGGNANGGYTVNRYADGSGSPITPGASCSGLQQGSPDPLTCTETGLPTGRWTYTVTPDYYNWIGTESNQSLHVIVAPAAPSSVSLINGGGVGSAYINSTNKSSLSIDVALTATSLSSDTVTLTLSDGPHTVTKTASGTAGTGTLHFTGVDASGLTDGTITISAKATSASPYNDVSGSTSISRTKDTVNPATAITISPSSPNGSGGWYDGSSPTFTLSATDTGGSGVATTSYQIDSGSTHAYPGSAVTIPDGSAQTVSYWSVDAAGNTETTHTTGALKIDTVAPTDTLTLGASPSHAFLTAGTLFYKSDTGGSFKLVDTVADSNSGPASATFPAIGTTGWTHNSETVSTPSGGPYQSANTFTWSATPTNPSGYTVTSKDVAGNTSTGASLTFQTDTTPPTGGSVAVTGLVGTGTAYSNSLTLSLSLSKGTDGSGSGVAASGATLLRAQGTLSSAGGTADGTCTSYGSFSLIATDPSSTTSNTVPTNNACYKYEYQVPDNVGNVATYTSSDVKVETTAPGSLAPTFTFTSLTGSVSVTSNTIYFHQNSTAGGSFKVTASATDAQSGVTGFAFPSAPSGWTVTGSGSSRTYSYAANAGSGVPSAGGQTVTATDNATLTGTASFTLTADNTAPATTITISPTNPNGTNGWYDSSSPTFTLSATDASGSGVANTFYNIDGGTTQTYAGAVPIPDGQHTISYWSVDAVGNIESTHTTGTIKVDTVKPSDAISLAASPSHAFLNGTRLYFEGNAAGSFSLVDTVNDVTSGAAFATFPTFNTLGWTGAGGTVSTPATGPYPSAYSWTAAQTLNPTSGTVSSQDNAGNTSIGTALTLVNDTTAPTGGALTPVGVTTSGGIDYSTTGTYTITRADYTETQTASQSGLASSTLTRQTGTWSASSSTCGSLGSLVTVTGNVSESGLAEGCYVYTLTGTDNVGNAATTTVTVVVDKTAPSANVLSISSGTHTFFAIVTGTNTLFYKGNATSGAFNLVDAVTDSNSGPASATFPAVGTTGWTHNAETVTSGSGTAPTIAYTSASAYAWSSANPSLPGDETITGKDVAGNASTATLHFVNDTTAPTGGILQVNGTGALSGGSSSTTTSTAFTIGSRTDYSEAQSTSQSGLATNGSVLTVQSETLTAGTCGAAGGPDATAQTLTGTTQPTGAFAIQAGFCYLYTLTGTDNVGNAASISTTVKVFTSPAVTSASPVGEGATNFNITVTGTGFVSGTDLATSVSGTGVTVNSTTFVSSTSLTVNVTVTSAAAPGTRNVTVTNPDGGAGTGTGALTVDTGPTITAPTSGTPFSLKHGDSGQMTITGTGFAGGLTTANISASLGHFTIDSIVSQTSTQIVVNVTAVTNSKGTSDLTVTNPDGGSATSTGAMINT